MFFLYDFVQLSTFQIKSRLHSDTEQILSLNDCTTCSEASITNKMKKTTNQNNPSSCEIVYSSKHPILLQVNTPGHNYQLIGMSLKYS